MTIRCRPDTGRSSRRCPRRAATAVGSRLIPPLEPFRLHRRGAYRQKQGDPEPRTVSDSVIEDLFAALGCNRDRALFSMFPSSGARAAEMLGMTIDDVPPPGEGRIYVQSKGLGRVQQACPASPEALSWLALYLGEFGPGRASARAARAGVVDPARTVAPADPLPRPSRHRGRSRAGPTTRTASPTYSEMHDGRSPRTYRPPAGRRPRPAVLIGPRLPERPAGQPIPG
ncbi:hypothetical protein GA0115254_10962 [Streptomyces sp. Ncost-T10-10d]|nr:hypothetical protein GA0115254_10962 [Streptomyces sp. Ncost-T10-10d]